MDPMVDAPEPMLFTEKLNLTMIDGLRRLADRGRRGLAAQHLGAAPQPQRCTAATAA